MNLETRNNLKNYNRDEQYILTVIALACNLVLIYFNSGLLDFTFIIIYYLYTGWPVSASRCSYAGPCSHTTTLTQNIDIHI